MTGEEKSWPAGTGTASKIAYPKPTKPSPFPQERLLWQAHRECIGRMDENPNPVNRLVSQIIAAAWLKSTNGGET